MIMEIVAEPGPNAARLAPVLSAGTGKPVAGVTRWSVVVPALTTPRIWSALATGASLLWCRFTILTAVAMI
jgi:hypothetical protein